jgi:hypothetical protein
MSTINVKLRIPRPAVCPTSIDDMIRMLESASITFPGSVPNFGPVEPGEDLRNAAWIKTDSNRNPLGTFTYSATAGRWLRDWAVPVGTLRTVSTSAANVQADREDKSLIDGWELADGSGISGLDLRDNPAFFKGAAPDYEFYTVLFTGYGDVVPVPNPDAEPEA